MTIRMKVLHDALVIRPAGDLEERDGLELLEQVQKELEPSPRDVVLNMSEVEGITAGALPYLFRIQKLVRASGNRCVLAETPESVLCLFDVTHVTARLDLAPSEEEALRATVP